MEDQYHTQMTGDRWWIAGGIGEDTMIEQSDVITLWEYDTPLATVTYVPGESKHTRGTYTITEHDIPDDRRTDDDLTGWRDHRDALEYATGVMRHEWDV